MPAIDLISKPMMLFLPNDKIVALQPKLLEKNLVDIRKADLN